MQDSHLAWIIAGMCLVAVVAGLAPMASTCAQPTSGPELLRYVVDAHQSSRELIRTCSCQVEFHGTVFRAPPEATKTESCRGDFWYSPDGTRGRVSEFDKEVDYVWKDSVRLAVSRATRSGKMVVGATRSAHPNRHIGRCDPWVRGLLVLNLPETVEYLSFEQLLATADKRTKTERSVVDGRDAVLVRLTLGKSTRRQQNWEIELLFDPAVNYLIRKAIYRCSGSKVEFVREDEVVEFASFGEGVYFPVRITGQSGPEPRFSQATTISDIRINQPLPDGILRIRLPEGVQLVDTIRNVRYRADAEGKPISPEKAMPVLPVVPPPSGGGIPPATAGTETREEPRGVSRWIILGSLSILLMAVILAIVHVRRSSHCKT